MTAQLEPFTPADHQKALADSMSEKQLQDCVIASARRKGWREYHTYDSRRSSKGFPDLVLVHPSGRLLFRELKTTIGRVSPEQKAWLAELTVAGVDARVWRPIDWTKGTIAEELTITTPESFKDSPWL